MEESGLAFRVAVSAAALMLGSATVAETITERFGKLEIIGEFGNSELRFNGKPLNPNIAGNNFLSFEKKIAFRDRDLVLIQDNGGTSCPSQFHIIDISKRGAIPTKAFGSCTEGIKVQKTKTGLRMTMGGYAGPGVEPQDVDTLTNKRYIYLYVNGKLSENGNPVL